MRILIPVVCAVPFTLWVQVQSTTPPNRRYSLLRENDDFSFLKDHKLHEDFWDPIKYILIGSKGWYLTIAGEVRQVFQKVSNDNWGRQPYSNELFLQRYMVHTDWRLGKHFRAFMQFKSGLVSGRQGGARPIDRKQLDFEAAFLEVGTSVGNNQLTLRVGRQELNYGSGRLVSVREGPNVRQNFDSFKIRSKVGVWSVDAFAVRPDLDKADFFNNAPNHATAFWCVYSSRPVSRCASLDLYHLGLGRQRATYDCGGATEVRHTTAERLSRPANTLESAWDFDYEAAWQFGTFGAQGVSAWTIATNNGYSLPNIRLRPRFSLKADISIGDDPRHKSLGTFSPIFPIGNYFGVLADTAPGPVNFIDLHPRAQGQLPHGVSVSTDLVLQWRQNIRDGVYAVPGFLLVPPVPVRRASSAIDPVSRYAGRSIGMHIFKSTTASSSQAASCAKPQPARTSTISPSGPGTNFGVNLWTDQSWTD